MLSNGTLDALSSHNGEDIDGSSSASANAGTSGTRSYTATGGFATAGTQISNSSSIKSKNDAIVGNATASANAFGSDKYTAFTAKVLATSTSYTYGACTDDAIFTCKIGTNAGHAYTAGTNFSSGSATGGTALAGVLITNSGTLTTNNEGIDGSATASADATGFMAFGGKATANTVITNSPAINSYWDGITGSANASADAFGQYKSSATYSGSGTGGTAVAGVVITNGTADPLSSTNGEGIDGLAQASANAQGWIALGGTAIATTTITNASTIRSWDDGIDGTAKANANADKYGSSGNHATGGTAIARVVIHNNTGGTISSINGEGIDGFAAANAVAGDKATTATGGHATATTLIYNFAAITSKKDGIHGAAKANASGYGSYAKGGSGTGGTAVAAVVITNTMAITSQNGEGIHGYSGAWAIAEGYSAFGGTASATTTITNAGAINSKEFGIKGVAEAFASADAGTSGGQNATGGTAVAGVVITNKTGGTISSGNNEGIHGYAVADATAGDAASTALGGHATATTHDHQLCRDHERWDGIHGIAKAHASGYGLYTPLDERSWRLRHRRHGGRGRCDYQ